MKLLNETGLAHLWANLKTLLQGKQDTLTAGTGIDITNNVISATGGGGTSYTAGDGVSIDSNNVINIKYPQMLPIPFTYNWTITNDKDAFISKLKAGEIVIPGAKVTSITPSDITSTHTYMYVVGNSYSSGKVSVERKSGNIPIADNQYYYLVQHQNENTLYRFQSPESWIKTIPLDINGSEMSTYRSTLVSLLNGKMANLTPGTGINISNGVISSTVEGIPTAPVNDGTYMLKCVVSSGTPTYSWENITIGGSY